MRMRPAISDRRGGMSIHYDFPVGGEYAMWVRLQRQYPGLPPRHGTAAAARHSSGWQAAEAVHGRRRGQGSSRGGKSYAGDGGQDLQAIPNEETYMPTHRRRGHLKCRVPVQAGFASGGRVVRTGAVGARRSAQPDAARRVYISNDQVYMSNANLGSVQIGGPYNAQGPANQTASRRAIFVCQPPKAVAGQRDCAATILSRMARLACRRPAAKTDTDTLLQFFDKGSKDGERL